MGILNVTPDSFHTASRQNSTDELLANANGMLEEGADILDIGGYSSRPGAEHISLEEERTRTIPAIKAVHNAFPDAIISVDTFRAAIANEAVEAGAAIVNDISGGTLDPDLHKEVAQLGVPYVLMHMRGTPQNMAGHTDYPDVLQEVMTYFSKKIQTLRKLGVNDIIVDPGFGFAKKREQGFELFNKLEVLHTLGCPLMIGVSRKSMIAKTLEVAPADALNGSTILHTIALIKGAHLLRVHDVKETAEAITLSQKVGIIK